MGKLVLRKFNHSFYSISMVLKESLCFYLLYKGQCFFCVNGEVKVRMCVRIVLNKYDNEHFVFQYHPMKKSESKLNDITIYKH